MNRGDNRLSGDPWWSEYLLQHALGDLHVLHGDDVAELVQGVNVPDLVHELHTAQSIRDTSQQSGFRFRGEIHMQPRYLSTLSNHV